MGRQETFDLIVIGAGVNGAGIARDASRRGLSVQLLEKADICSGTSSWSSRLIHGGLRYLEYFEIGLVRQSLSERERLLKLAPHLVKPIGMYVPIFRDGLRPKWKIRAGMFLYDLLSRGKSVPNHRMLSSEEMGREAPGLLTQGLNGGAHYFDAQVTYAERLVLANVLDAHRSGAAVEVGAKVLSPEIQNGRILGVRWQSNTDGNTHLSRAPVVFNATGAWVDELTTSFAKRRFIGGTKGSHIVVDRIDGTPTGAVYSEAHSDGRPFFIIPWNGMQLIGTTDIRFEGDPGEASISESELSYLLTETNRLFPSARLQPGHVRFSYSGVRPLPHRPKGQAGSISRDHQIVHHRRFAKGFFSVIGGKLTTYRALAEEAVDKVVRRLGRGRSCTTREVPLPGAGGDVEHRELVDRCNRSTLPADLPQRLWSVYGAEAHDLLDQYEQSSEPAQRFANGTLLGAELIHGLEQEWADSLDDLLQRRLMLGLGRDFGISAAEVASRYLEERGVWGAERARQELNAYLTLARKRGAQWASSSHISD